MTLNTWIIQTPRAAVTFSQFNFNIPRFWILHRRYKSGVLRPATGPSPLSRGPFRGTKQRADNPTQWRRRRLPDHPGALLASRCVFYLGTSRSRPPGRAFGGRTPQLRSAAPVESADTIAPPGCGLILGRGWFWWSVVLGVIKIYCWISVDDASL